jgi:hypothetical protein
VEYLVVRARVARAGAAGSAARGGDGEAAEGGGEGRGRRVGGGSGSRRVGALVALVGREVRHSNAAAANCHPTPARMVWSGPRRWWGGNGKVAECEAMMAVRGRFIYRVHRFKKSVEFADFF